MSTMQASNLRTIVTQPGETALIYQPNAPTIISLQKHTAGVVLVGTFANLSPLSSGNGIQLTSTNARYLFMFPGDVLYLYAESVEEVSIAAHNLTPLLQMLAPAVPTQPTPPVASPVNPATIGTFTGTRKPRP